MPSAPATNYTVFIQPPVGDWQCGDITITDGLGRFCTFFWGAGEWLDLGDTARSVKLGTWLSRVSDKLGENITQADQQAVFAAVLGDVLPE